MTEQIRTLAEQAGMNKMNQRSDGFFVVDEKVFEKFALLIVKEVLDVIDRERFEIYPPVLQRVREHFGG
jgi:hypothetical protein